MKRIDSHVHLYKKSHENVLAWMSSGHPLEGNHELEEYLSEAGEQPPLGIIYVETDRKIRSSDEGEKWDYVIEEYNYVSTIKNPIIMGAVLWAPLHEGPESMETYLHMLKNTNSKSIDLIKGFRYLLQDKPLGTATEQKFLKSLEWIASRGLVFEIGIDVRSGGIGQAKDVLQMVNSCPKLTYIIDHITKPDMVTENVTEEAVFKQWAELMRELARANIYVKISGIFNELPKSLVDSRNMSKILDRLAPWLEIVLQYWHCDRILWGSDWPVCKIGGGDTALQFWNEVSIEIVKKYGFSEKESHAWYFNNCVKAYNINLTGRYEEDV